mgnify:CR=1 FL=1
MKKKIEKKIDKKIEKKIEKKKNEKSEKIGCNCYDPGHHILKNGVTAVEYSFDNSADNFKCVYFQTVTGWYSNPHGNAGVKCSYNPATACPDMAWYIFTGRKLI